MREYKLAVLFKNGSKKEERLTGFDDPPHPTTHQAALDKAMPVLTAFYWNPDHQSIELTFRLEGKAEWNPLYEWPNENLSMDSGLRFNRKGGLKG